MKTLDEVIEAFETCIVPKNVFCKECGFEDRCRITDDALHYLKAYKAKQDEDWWKEYIAMRNEIIFNDLEANTVLTWDELKQMVGKPVWVEYQCYTPDWEVIERIGNSKLFDGEFIETHMSILHKETIGTEWQAYRKERE